MPRPLQILSTAQMREADRRCIEELGIPGAVLMNNAGAAVFAVVKPGPVGIVCGRGNNGGDGYVVARLALIAGHDVQVVSLGDPVQLRGDAEVFCTAYRRLGGSVVVVNRETEVVQALAPLQRCVTIVDAILGTGIQGEVRGLARAAIVHWPRMYTIAVDTPSGLNTDTGEPCGACICADVTVTFQYTKAGFGMPAAAPYLGRVIVADIGIPDVCADDAAWQRLTSSWA